MSHGSETWLVKKENELALQQAEMRMIRWMCGIKVTDRFTCNERNCDIFTVLRQIRLRWYRHVLRKYANDWVKNVWIQSEVCKDLEVG